MPEEERGDLLGECDLIMSFLCYNDISAMSRLHRSASQRMSRPAISIRNDGGWTFGSPSVLMMFHREEGALERELAEMDECMPHYYKVTRGHGQGAEVIMRAEAAFLRGDFTDARIALEQAYARIAGNGQENMALCCDFLAWRLSLWADAAPRYGFARRRAALLSRHNTDWLRILDAVSAYYYALRGQTEEIPVVFREHRLSDVPYLAPGRPMMELVENQVYLAQGAYTQVIGRSEGLLAVCGGMHYALVALHVRIQTAASYEMLGKRAEARILLRQALDSAAADGFIMPFAENGRYVKTLLEEEQDSFAGEILTLLERREAQCWHTGSPALSALTAREQEIVALIVQRRSNREIAEALYLSEGSVKQYVNRIYGKLAIEGDTRTKRRRLMELANS